ncbi:UNVERIFIED_CONTAM: hypothetical protein HDU68_008184 [Siphonaria sp. JEL0065]|nr:hypothetical protein HDU68_008184 [Siphonaria sp. JEL0065]
MPSVYLLDYGAGNVRSLVNAVNKLGYEINPITCPEDFAKADKIIFPGVGSFGFGVESLRAKGFEKPLLEYLASGKPFFGICVGMQCLFESSEESVGVAGLGLIQHGITRFSTSAGEGAKKSVPHMGWNAAVSGSPSEYVNHDGEDTRYYFVHSFAGIVPANAFTVTEHQHLLPGGWSCTLTTYHNETFISSIKRGNVFATQFHPEKSGTAGLKLLASFLNADPSKFCQDSPATTIPITFPVPHRLSRRIIACLDVRTNDAGDLVVTKGDQYDVRETSGSGHVRNLGKPVDLSADYYNAGADEITFLNITSFRGSVLADDAMLEVVNRASERVFVPLTVGGGIRDLTDSQGVITSTALEVAAEYFRSGADKVSIGSDAVYAAEAYYKNGNSCDGTSSIEQISRVYGAQAVVISVDPKRVYVKNAEEARGHALVELSGKDVGPNGETLCWYQCTVKGGRESRDLDVRQLVVACEALGAGEVLCNCMDKDGTNSGFDHGLLNLVKNSVSIPVIASSGAGKVEHFTECFSATDVEAALAAGIFHRKEVAISQVKEELRLKGFEARRMDVAL